MPNFSRKDMPQVTTQNMSKALDRVADKVKLSKQTISASKLKKSQKELYKVLSLIINCEIQNDSPHKSNYKNSSKEKFY